MYDQIYEAEPVTNPTGEAFGLYRDGRYLVVDLDQHRFPPRCVKSDLPVNVPPAYLTLRTYNVNGEELNLMRNVVVASAGQPLTINETNKGNNVIVPLVVPLGHEWQAKLGSNFGLILAVSSIVLTVLLFIATIMLAISDNDWFFVPAIGCGFGVVGMISGFVLMTRRDYRVVSIQRLADRKVWLRGVHHDWLARLPEFRLNPAFLGREYKRAVSSTWWSFGTALVFGMAAVVCVLIAASGYLRGVASRDWPSVQGTIGSAHITEHSSSRRGRTTRWWNVNFDYHYEVNGDRLSGSSYEKEHSADAAQANLQSKPPGTPIGVYYNPTSPADHRLTPGISDAEILWIIAAVAVSSVALIACAYGMAARSRATRFQWDLDELTRQQPFGQKNDFGFPSR